MKRKTSINIDEEIWRQFILFVVKKYGSSRKISQALTEAIQQYMQQI